MKALEVKPRRRLVPSTPTTAENCPQIIRGDAAARRGRGVRPDLDADQSIARRYGRSARQVFTLDLADVRLPRPRRRPARTASEHHRDAIRRCSPMPIRRSARNCSVGCSVSGRTKACRRADELQRLLSRRDRPAARSSADALNVRGSGTGEQRLVAAEGRSRTDRPAHLDDALEVATRRRRPCWPRRPAQSRRRWSSFAVVRRRSGSSARIARP